MASPENQQIIEPVRPPVLKEPGAIVENIHAVPGTTSLPDLDSQDTMAEYLIERFNAPAPAARTRVVLTPTGRSLPGLSRTPAGFKEVSRWRKTAEWWVSPRQAAAVVLGSMALFNGIGNHSTIGGGVEYVGHEIYRLFVPVPDVHKVEHHQVEVPGKVSHISLTAAAGDQVNSTIIDSAVTQQFVTSVERAQQNGGNVVSVMITGNTSDEWGGDSSIGAPDPQNAQLGYARAQAAVQQLANEGLNVSPSILHVAEDEHVITAQQKAELLAESEAAGLPTISAAIEAVDNNQPVPASLMQKIKQLFTGTQDRGVSLDATIVNPGHEHIITKTTKVTVPGKDNPPEVPKPHWYWFVPMVPIRRRERYSKVKQMHQWEFSGSKQFYRPDIIREEADQAWLRLRPEAVNKDGTLVDRAWAFTRKYEHLLRDDRIADLLRADFKNADGEDKSLHIAFIDQAPAQETIAVFEELLRKFAAMSGGKLGDRVSGIFVYLSENAGTEHGDPKRIAIGIDGQSPAECLGTYTYPLKLVELHMPATWDPEDLEAMLSGFNGSSWVMAHEVAGHATDRNDNPQTLRRVLARGIPNAHVIDGDVRSYSMARLTKTLQKLPGRPRRNQSPQPIEYDISYPVQDASGKTVTITARVGENDPRLAHAAQSTIVGYQPTQYSGQNDSEHYAETAASVTTGIRVPYEETGKLAPQLQTDDGQPALFAEGYKPDERGQRLFTDTVGAEAGSFPAEFSGAPAVTFRHINPANDPLLRGELIRTRRVRTPRPEEMVAILARVARRRQ